MPRGLLAEQRLPKTNRDAEIRAAESLQYRVRNSDYFSLLVEERATRATGSGLRVEYYFIGQHIAYVSLCDKRTNQATAREFVQNLRHIATAVRENLLRRIFIGAREDGGKAGRIAHQHDRLAARCGGLACIHREHGALQVLYIHAHRREVRILRYLLNLRVKRPRITGKICADQRNFGLKSLGGELFKLVVPPPGLGDVTVREHASAGTSEEARTEDIELYFRPAALEREDRISATVLQRLALRVQAGIAEPLPALFLIECHRDVQQANALNVHWD